MMRARLPLAALATLVGVAIAGPAAAQNKPRSGSSYGLEDAYKREFAYLEAEKQTLEKRLAQEQATAAARAKKARDEISALQARIVSASSEAERLSELVLSVERDIDAVEASDDVGEDLLLRAESTFKKLGVDLPEADTKDPAKLLEQLTFVFDRAPGALTGRSQVRIENGTYYNDAGVKVEGAILRVGDIASYGLADGARGPLAPAGGDRLKLWNGGGDAAAALARGESPESMPIFLYESLEKGVEKKKDKTVREVIETGGIIGWVIVFLGCIAGLMIAVRAGILFWVSRGTRRLLDPVLSLIERGKAGEAARLAARSRSSAGRVLTATVENLDKSREQIEDVVAEAVLHEQPHLSRFGSSIMVVAAVSPLLGLLGTVTGMISTFDIITEFGTGNPKLLSGGISEALITTELGLIVAIPALLCGHILTGWSERIRDKLDASALAAVNRAVGLKPPEDDQGAFLPDSEEDTRVDERVEGERAA